MTDHFTQEEVRAALAQVLDALQGLLNTPNDDSPESVASCILYHGKALRALTAGRAALAQPQGEDTANGRINRGDETGGAVERFGWHLAKDKPEIVPATNGAFVWYRDYLRLWKTHPQASEPAPSAAGEAEWLQCGSLLYRLTDDRHPQNCDEINVTMANGSRVDSVRAEKASTLLALLQSTAQPVGELTDEQIDAAVKAWFGAEVEAKGFKTRMRLAIEAAQKIGCWG